MKAPISIKFKIASILLVAAAALQALSFLAFTNVDIIVNYKLGLLDFSWLDSYQNQLNMFLIAFIISIMLIVVLAIIVWFITRKQVFLTLSKYVIPPVIIGVNTFSALTFNGINLFVNSDLYSYGLQYSLEWASPLISNTLLLLTLFVLSSSIVIAASFLIHFGAREVTTVKFMKTGTNARRIQNAEMGSFVLINAGTVALLSSIFLDSSVLAIIGIGLLFWGILFMYIRKEENTRNNLWKTAVSQQMEELSELSIELNYQGETIYLPPKYFSNPETQKVFISKKKESKLPTPELIQNQESRIFIKKPKGLLLTPLGSELIKIFEKRLGSNLAEADFQHLQANLSQVIIEDLELAKDLKIKIEKNEIFVEIQYFADIKIEKDSEKGILQSALNLILSSAFACALAKTIDQPIIIKKQEVNNKTKNVIITYQIITEGVEKQP